MASPPVLSPTSLSLSLSGGSGLQIWDSFSQQLGGLQDGLLLLSSLGITLAEQ